MHMSGATALLLLVVPVSSVTPVVQYPTLSEAEPSMAHVKKALSVEGNGKGEEAFMGHLKSLAHTVLAKMDVESALEDNAVQKATGFIKDFFEDEYHKLIGDPKLLALHDMLDCHVPNKKKVQDLSQVLLASAHGGGSIQASSIVESAEFFNDLKSQADCVLQKRGENAEPGAEERINAAVMTGTITATQLFQDLAQDKTNVAAHPPQSSSSQGEGIAILVGGVAMIAAGISFIVGGSLGYPEGTREEKGEDNALIIAGFFLLVAGVGFLETGRLIIT